MKLFYSPFHTFVHKALVTAHEAGVHDQIEYVPTFPFRNNDGDDVSGHYPIAEINPLAKVPTLALDDGTVLYNSQVIIEYLDSLRTDGKTLFPKPGPARWDAIRRLALADTIFELTVIMVMEGWHPEEQRRVSVYETIWAKCIRGLDVLDAAAEKGFPEFDAGQVGMLQAISYIDFRGQFYLDGDPVHPGFDWRDGRKNLVKWFDDTIKRPSVAWRFNVDFEGDMSPENLRRHVQEVLKAQKSQ